MDVVYHRVGELRAILRMLADATLLFQSLIHALDILCGDEGHLLVPQYRFDIGNL